MKAGCVLLCVLLGLPTLASGAEGVIYRCKGANGVTSFQTDPCPPGSEIKGSAVYTPDRERTPAERRAWERFEDEQRQRTQRAAGTAWIDQPPRTVYTGPSPADPNSRAARRADCERARQARDAYQFQRGARANDAVMAWHRGNVQALCHGF
jgi:hypothetical protein